MYFGFDERNPRKGFLDNEGVLYFLSELKKFELGMKIQ